MFQNGLLVVTLAVVRGSSTSLNSLIQSCARQVRSRLYVHLVNLDASTVCSQLRNNVAETRLVPFQSIALSQSVRQFITNFYARAANTQQSLEVRFLLSNIGGLSAPVPVRKPQLLNCAYDIVLTDVNKELHPVLAEYVSSSFPIDKDVTILQLDESNVPESSEVSESDLQPMKTYYSVCLGGTFDQLHAGHHILLTEGCLISHESMLVGVTHGPMNENKILSELMQSTEERIEAVRQFVTEVKPNLSHSIVPITDPYGPPITNPNFDCIVVSSETVRGAEAINTKRKAQGMSELAVDVIELVADPQHSLDEEEKLSSSSFRKRLLGTLLRSPLKEASLPYIIGLTGSTASGKSSVCKRLERLGAFVIDCDKLGHQSYQPGTPTYDRLIMEFGQDIVGSDNSIDRRRLGSRVFQNKDELAKLNAIVWPAILQLCGKEIESASSAGYKVVVADAAVLLEAGWDDIVHEVWTTVIPVKEAVRRLVERNGLAEDEALRRVQSQMSNEQRVSRANVVLCTLWHYDVTQKQVENAWHLLEKRISPSRS